jgi:regulator of replication initiation timing
VSDDTPDVEELDAKIKALSEAVGNARSSIDDLEEELQEEREERRRLEEENEELRERLDELDARTDLLSLVQNSDEMPAKQRQTALIQNLKEAAQRQDERDLEPKASLTPDQARAALGHPYSDPSHVYRDMKRAAEILGDKDVLWYENGGYGDTRLKIDLTDGDIPAAISGRF